MACSSRAARTNAANDMCASAAKRRARVRGETPAARASSRRDTASAPRWATSSAAAAWPCRPAAGKNAFSFPFANLDDDERQRFAVGNSFFRRNWVEAPSSTAARDGLGPHFIARSCGGCHVQDGRGAPPDFKHGVNEQPIGLLIRLSVPVKGSDPLATAPEPTYGDQFNNRAVGGVRPEGQVRIHLTPVKGRFADGTPYTLQKPMYGFADLGYGPMHPDVMLSPRIAPQIIGVGLLEAIAEADILAEDRMWRLEGFASTTAIFRRRSSASPASRMS